MQIGGLNAARSASAAMPGLRCEHVAQSAAAKIITAISLTGLTGRRMEVAALVARSQRTA
jgi:hypothetical protein